MTYQKEALLVGRNADYWLARISWRNSPSRGETACPRIQLPKRLLSSVRNVTCLLAPLSWSKQTALPSSGPWRNSWQALDLGSPYSLFKQDIQPRKGEMKWVRNDSNLVWLIGAQPAAEVCVAPSESFVPGWWDKHLILFYCKNAFIGAHYLSHRFFEFYTKQIITLQQGQGNELHYSVVDGKVISDIHTNQAHWHPR